MSATCITAALAAMSVLVLPALHAQADRYELGLRLRDFERQLAVTTDAARRDAAFVELDRAVQAFFRLDTKAVAAAIDAASFALRGTPARAGERFARSLQLQAEARLVDTTQASVALTLGVAFAVAADDDEARPKLAVRAWLDGTAAAAVEQPLDAVPLQLALPLAGVPAGDHVLRWCVRAGDVTLVERRQGLSVVERRDARLAALAAAVRDEGRTLEARTLDTLTRLVAGMTKKRAEETVLPGARLLAEAERLAPAAPDERLYDARCTGQYWLRVPVGAAAPHVRLFVPEGIPADARRTIVVALHGAGGSENLFFDGYGDGEVVRQCAQRGWFCVAPRASLGAPDVPGLVDALAERWPIDRERVLVVGHSMGAAMAVATAVRAPQRLRAVALLGGSGAIGDGAGITKLPWFVGTGTRDFARGGAVGTAAKLRAVGAATELREYEGVEHLAIVQLALPDVFAWFDGVLR